MAKYNFCEDIAALQSVKPNCQLVAGYENIGFIIARRDIDFAGSVKDADNSNLITNLALGTGNKFECLGQLKDSFSDTTVSLNQGTFRNTFTHQVSFKIFDNSAERTKMINGLANGEYVMVLEQKHKSEFSGDDETVVRTYRVFGWENGLVASAIDNDNNSEDIADGWSITLEETNASSAAYYLTSDNVVYLEDDGTHKKGDYKAIFEPNFD